ncbi:MAG: hypothetical protein ACTHOH_12320 [Lysobacteraceae bacterium]
MKEAVSLQHGNTDIPEIAGTTVENLVAVRGSGVDRVLLIYLLLDGNWLKLFLDEGVLFVSVSDGPDAEDDLDAGDAYMDFPGLQGMRGEEIRRASVKNGAFRIVFKSGAELILEASGDEATLKFVK